MSLNKFTVFRNTRKGDWMAKNGYGTEILLPKSDERLSVGSEIIVDGIKEGDHVNFPRYGLYYIEGVNPSPNKKRGNRDYIPGIITQDFVLYGQFEDENKHDHWYADISSEFHFFGMNLNKKRGPRDARVGTMVDILEHERGMRHRWCNDWDVSETQYPLSPLTEEQKSIADRISEERLEGKGRIGTVALMTNSGLIIKSDYVFESESEFGKLEADAIAILNTDKPELREGTRVIYDPAIRYGRWDQVFSLETH